MLRRIILAFFCFFKDLWAILGLGGLFQGAADPPKKQPNKKKRTMYRRSNHMTDRLDTLIYIYIIYIYMYVYIEDLII